MGYILISFYASIAADRSNSSLRSSQAMKMN